MEKKEVNDSIFSLNYVIGQLKIYGEKNDYSHDLLLRHIDDVVKRIKEDEAKKESQK